MFHHHPLTRRRFRPILIVCAAMFGFAAHGRVEASSQSDRRAQQAVVIDGTLEASASYLRVHVQLSQGRHVLTGQPFNFDILGFKDLGLKGLMDADQPQGSFLAFLDTGASSHVISKMTAERFGIEAVPGAVYHEVGLHDEKPMDVSRPYGLALSGSTGKLHDQPGTFHAIDGDVALQINRQLANNSLVTMALGEINVIGMPAIRRLLVEIDPHPGLGQGGGGLQELQDLLDGDLLNGDLLDQLGDVVSGPAVYLHPPKDRPTNVDVRIPLVYVNFARHHNPRDHGPRPVLAPNPTIKSIETGDGERRFVGDWLLDTGAPVSMISTRHAIALGLYDEDGQPRRQQDFSLPLGGVGGQVKSAAGFRIDFMRVPAAGGRMIEYRQAHVVVHDVSTELDNGQTITLDGIFGTNFLLSTVGGLGLVLGIPSNTSAGPFKHIWIDGPRRQLLLELAEHVGGRSKKLKVRDQKSVISTVTFD